MILTNHEDRHQVLNESCDPLCGEPGERKKKMSSVLQCWLDDVCKGGKLPSQVDHRQGGEM